MISLVYSLPIKKYIKRAINIDGIVVGSMLRIWLYKLAPTIPAAKLVVSESGDILSPNHAPETIAPALRYPGIPMLSPIPINAKPSVPIVPQEVPVATDIMAQTIVVIGKKVLGSRILSPVLVNNGTVPLKIQDPIVIPTAMKIHITGIERVIETVMPF